MSRRAWHAAFKRCGPGVRGFRERRNATRNGEHIVAPFPCPIGMGCSLIIVLRVIADNRIDAGLAYPRARTSRRYRVEVVDVIARQHAVYNMVRNEICFAPADQ